MAEASDGLRLRGQSEPLTRRLKRLLDEYSDGLAVPKELLQNADDAGATEVTLVYDCRENTDSRGAESLLDPAMADCQGRALWAHNNATFSDEDFDNILQLSGATKLEKTAKVGRFGLGFNSVYNLTDVPQILSRHRMLVLDPHGEQAGDGYLEAVYASQKSRNTGVELNFKIKQALLKTFSNQLAPYAGVLSCNLAATGGNFNGTLLRLPLRTEDQARKSKICNRVYSDKEMRGLLKLLADQADTILLFTQTVQELRCLYLPSNAVDPRNDAELVFSVKKCPLKYFQRHSVTLARLPLANISQDTQQLAAQCSTLKVAELLIESGRQDDTVAQQESRSQMTVELKLVLGSSAKDQFRITAAASSRVWLVCAAVGSGESLAMSIKKRQLGLAPVGAVALAIYESQRMVPLSRHSQPASTLFCFLPLPVENPFPVLLNASFSVTSSRRHLNEVTVDEKQDAWSPGQWNRVLLTDVICAAYIDSLRTLTQLQIANPEIFLQMWPRFESATQAVWRPLIEKFYSDLLSSETPLFHTSAGWKSLSMTVFLDPSLLSLGEVSECLGRLATKIVGQNEGVAKLTEGVERTVEQLQLMSKILARQLSAEKLLTGFIQRMAGLWNSGQTEDCLKVLTFILDNCSKSRKITWDRASEMVTQAVVDQMKRCSCIPNVLNSLCSPSQLLDPNCLAAGLYDKHELVFPHLTLQTDERLKALRLIGLRKDLTWNEVLDRAQSLARLSGEKRLDRTVVLLSYLDSSQLKFKLQLSTLRTVAFLPALRRSANSCVSWQSDKYPTNKLVKPSKLFHADCKDLVSASQLILDCEVLRDVSISRRGSLLSQIGVLSLADITPAISGQQLTAIVRTQLINEETLRLSQCVYRHLSDKIRSRMLHDKDIASLLHQNATVIWSRTGFLRPGQVTRHNSESELPPFLFVLPRELNEEQYLPFLKAAGVRESFKAADYAQVVNQIANRYQSTPLKAEDLDIILKCLQLISHCSDGSLQRENLILLAPDQSAVMLPVSQLCFNNLPWIEAAIVPGGPHFCHKEMSFALCERLKIPSKREAILCQEMQPLPFGQQEDLTTRLKNIISGYPLGRELFKELIQNADDAGASEISFIVDFQSHGTEKVLSDNWKQLQGPALVVHNDSTFSEAEITGVQNLGLGSKRDDAWKAGHYGIGFNCVYNITDAPSFLSDGRVLCVMDPHCRYMPGASVHSPGGMFRKIDHLRHIFQDVFNGYLPDVLTHAGSTVFRFPLRTEEAANESKICEKAVSPEKMKSLFEELKEDLELMLLFLKNLRRVNLCEIAECDGALKSIFTIKAQALDISRSIPIFNDQCKLASRQLLDQPKLELHQRISCSVAYELNTCIFYSNEQSKKEQSWLVCQSLGCQTKSLANKLQKEVACESWRLLPIVGVAAPIQHGNSGTIQGQVYCLLPLPVTTDLPVQVNGHFILDPSRRCLWKSDGDADHKEQWNRLLATDLLPKCYASLLETAKRYASGVDKVRNFYALFPQYNKRDKTIWDELIKMFFKTVIQNRVAIFPVFDELEMQLKWFPLAQSSADIDGRAAFLNPDSKPDPAIKVARRLLFPIIEPDKVHLHRSLESLKSIFVPVADVASIVAFIRGPVCESLRNSLPKDVSETPFQSAEAVVDLLAYLIRKANRQLRILLGTPLAICAGNRLSMLGDDAKPLYLTKYSDLFLHTDSKYELAHDAVASKFFNDEQIMSLLIGSKLFKLFELQDFSRILKLRCPQLFTDANNLPAAAELGLESDSSSDWLKTVWDFLSFSCTTSCSTPKDIVQKLSSTGLGNACLIPVNNSRFACISQAQCVYKAVSEDLDDCSKAVEETLEELNAPSLRIVADLKLIRDLCGNVRKPGTMLRVVEFALNENPKRSPLSESQAVSLILYINNNWRALSDSHEKEKILLDRVRKLPVFVTSDGRCLALNSDPACVLPASLVADEMSTCQGIFLKDNEALKPLYAKLECDEMPEAEVYARFILPMFSNFSDETRLKHLERLCRLSWDFEKLEMEKVSYYKPLIASLRAAKLIPVEGVWKPVNSFFDHRLKVLKKFMSSDKFLPESFREKRWRTLMVSSGLSVRCSADSVIDFARQLAAEGAKSMTQKVQKKSEQLLKFIGELIDLEKALADTEVIRQLSEIPFVLANTDRGLQSLCPSEDVCMTSLSKCVKYESRFLCWTEIPYAPSCVQQRSCLEKFMKQVTDEVIIKHLERLFSAPTFSSSDLPSETRILRQSVMSSVYEKLIEMPPSKKGNLISKLRKVECILINENSRDVFVTAERITFYQKCANPPYILMCPRDFSRFQSLFVQLGATKSATMEQNWMALQRIHDEQQDRLSDEQQRAVGICMSNMIALLERGGKLVDSKLYRTLFLPTKVQQSRSERAHYSHFQLVDSKLLTINDSEGIHKRLAGAPGVQLLDLSFCNLGSDNLRRLYFHLAEDWQLRRLSDNVREKLQSDCLKLCTSAELCEARCNLDAKLKHPVLHQCITSIILHGTSDLSVKGDQTLSAVSTLLSRFSVVCLSELITCLVLNDAEQGDSEEEKNFLLDGQKVLMNHSRIRYDCSDSEGTLWHLDFVDAVLGILKNGFTLSPEQMSNLTLVLLMNSPEGMLSIITRKRISLYERPNQKYTKSNARDASRIGNPVQRFQQCLLNQLPAKPNELLSSRLVAYRNQDGIFQYARVLEKQSTDVKNPWTSWLTVSVGSDSPITAQIFELYSFEDWQNLEPSSPLITEADIEAVLDPLLGAAAELTVEQQQAILQRLLAHYSASHQSHSLVKAQAAKHGWTQKFSDCIDRWRDVAAEVARYRLILMAEDILDVNCTRHRERSHFSGTESFNLNETHGSMSSPASAHDNARSDLNSSGDDLRTVAVLIETCNYNWACYISWQAAEKAIRALLMIQRQPVELSHQLSQHLCRIEGDDLQGSLADHLANLARAIVDGSSERSRMRMMSDASADSEAERAARALQGAQCVVHRVSLEFAE